MANEIQSKSARDYLNNQTINNRWHECPIADPTDITTPNAIQVGRHWFRDDLLRLRYHDGTVITHIPRHDTGMSETVAAHWTFDRGVSTPPFSAAATLPSVGSTATMVANLNADYLHGYLPNSTNVGNTIGLRLSDGRMKGEDPIDADDFATKQTVDDLGVFPPGAAGHLVAWSATAPYLVSVTNLATYIASTANQVTATDDGDGTVTLSLPQDIHTGATPTWVNAILTGLTQDTPVIASDVTGLFQATNPITKKLYGWNTTSLSMEFITVGTGLNYDVATSTITSTGLGGTVTSITATEPAAGFTIGGSPITTSGTLLFALSHDLAAVEGLSGFGIAQRTAASTWATQLGTANYIPKWSATAPYLTSFTQIYDNGTGVGIGTTSPATLLHLAGANPQLLIRGTANAHIGFWGDGNTADSRRFTLTTSTDSIRFTSHFDSGIGKFNLLAMLSSGQVGVGTLTPLSKLSINGGLHVGGDSDAGDNNAIIDGTLLVTGALTNTNLTASRFVKTGAGGLLSVSTGLEISLAEGGTGQSLSDPGGHRLLGWDDTDTAVKWINIGTGLSYDAATDTLSSSGGAGGGTVTSVAVTEPTAGLDITGGPITGAGTFVFTLADDLLAVEGISTTGVVLRTASNTWSTVTILDRPNGGLGVALTDPGADRLLGWDNTNNDIRYFIIGAGLSYDAATDTLTASGAALSQGNGIVISGSTIHFASSSNYTPGAIFYASSTTAVGQSAALTGILQGNGTAAPTAATGTAGRLAQWAATAPFLANSIIGISGQVVTLNGGSSTLTTSSGTLTLGSTNVLVTSLALSKPVFTDASKNLVSTGTVPADQGGTGLSVYVTGDILYADTTSTLTTLGASTSGMTLHTSGTGSQPSWAFVSLTTDVSGILALSKGGTGVNLSNPTVHKILGWDNTDADVRFFTIGAGLSYDPATDTLSSTGGSGSVTQVAAVQPVAGFQITGSPITTTGTFTFLLSDDLAGVEGLSTFGIVQRTALNTWSTTLGTANYIPKWSATTPYLTTTSLVYDTGTNVGIGTTTPNEVLQVIGNLSTYHASAISGSGYLVHSYTDTTGSTKADLGMFGITQYGANVRKGAFSVYLANTSTPYLTLQILNTGAMGLNAPLPEAIGNAIYHIANRKILKGDAEAWADVGHQTTSTAEANPLCLSTGFRTSPTPGNRHMFLQSVELGDVTRPLILQPIGGYVGINTSTAVPSAPLTVKTALGGRAIDIIAEASGIGIVQFLATDGTTLQGGMYGATGRVTIIDAASINVLTVTASKVGIMNIAPAATLDVSGTVLVSGAVTLTSLLANRFVRTTTAGLLTVSSAATIDLTLEVAGILPVPNGGTGAGTFTDGGVLIGNGTGIIQATSAGTAGQLFQSGGTGVDPFWAALPSHTHSASEVVSGVFVTARLAGTGTADSTTFLRGDSTWAVVSSSGVTSVAATQPTAGFTITGSPITTTGAFTFTLADDLAAVEAMTGTGVALRTGTSTWSTISGSANQMLGMNAAGTATEFKTLVETANQVSVTHGVGTVTFTLPQDIATSSSPQFASVFAYGSSLPGLVAAVSSESTNALVMLARSGLLRRLELLYVGTSSTSVYGIPLGGVGINAAATSLTLSTSDAARLVISTAGVVNIPGLLGSRFVKTDGSSNLTVSGGSTISLTTEASGILPVPNGGTGVATLADAGVLIGNGTAAVQVTGPGTAGQVLTSNGSGVDPTFQTPSGGGAVANDSGYFTKILTDGASDDVFEVAIPTTTAAGIGIEYELSTTNGTDMSSNSGFTSVCFSNKGGTVTHDQGRITANGAHDSATPPSMSHTMGFTNGAGKLIFWMFPISDLTGGVIVVTLRYKIYNPSALSVTHL